MDTTHERRSGYNPVINPEQRLLSYDEIRVVFNQWLPTINAKHDERLVVLWNAMLDDLRILSERKKA